MELKKIPLTQVLVNEKNIYDEQLIEELAKSIRTYGQLENATVYENGTVTKPYTLVGGHRRFLALSWLAERGEGPRELICSVVPKPDLVVQEKMLIVHDNQQRKKDKETKIREVQAANEYWLYLKENGRKPEGKRRAWIASQVGMSERAVQDLLTYLKKQASDPSGSQNGSGTARRIPDKSDAVRYIKNAMRNLAKVMEVDDMRTTYIGDADRLKYIQLDLAQIVCNLENETN